MFAALALASVLQSRPEPAPSAGALTVVVEGVRDTRGHVRIDLCRADTFLSGTCEVSTAVPAQKGEVTLTVADLPPGEYAIQAYHDADDNREVSRNALGIPIEEFGFSRSPPLGLHGPSFMRAAFVHGADAAQAVTVKLKRLF